MFAEFQKKLLISKDLTRAILEITSSQLLLNITIQEHGKNMGNYNQNYHDKIKIIFI